MLNTIQELEKEIEQFHRNIKESNELIQILRSVALISKEQTESFEKSTKSIYDELTKMPPEMCAIWEDKVDDLVKKLHSEHQLYQTAVSQLLDGCVAKVSAAEEVIAKVPLQLDEQNRDAQTKNLEELKQMHSQYAMDLSKVNSEFADTLQLIVKNVVDIPNQIKDTSEQQYSAFVAQIEKNMEEHRSFLAGTEKHISELSKQLEEKYGAFVSKLEATNMDQLYKYCQEMNRSINIKLSIALGGVAIAIVLSIVAWFI